MGQITDLKIHPKYPIVVKGREICSYTADFEYIQCGRYLEVPDMVGKVVEDVKGVRTLAYKFKKKLMKAVHGIEIREV